MKNTKTIIRKFEKQFNGFRKTDDHAIKELFDYDFGSQDGEILFQSESLEEAKRVFDLIQLKKVKLERGNIFNFYFLDKEIYDEDGDLIEVESYDAKHDIIED